MPGFEKPTVTNTPDALFDFWLPRLKAAELRVLLYAIRRTYGFGKDSDDISIDQFTHGITTESGRTLDEGCGVHRATVIRSIKSLVERGLLIKTLQFSSDDSRPRNTANNYRLAVTNPRTPRAAHGFRAINVTQVPDELFDYWLPRLSDPELYVLLYIIRRTLGFHKLSDVISREQFFFGITKKNGEVLDEGCGISHSSLYPALARLQDKGLVRVERRRDRFRGNMPSRYGLVFENELPAGIVEVASSPVPQNGNSTKDMATSAEGSDPFRFARRRALPPSRSAKPGKSSNDDRIGESHDEVERVASQDRGGRIARQRGSHSRISTYESKAGDSRNGRQRGSQLHEEDDAVNDGESRRSRVSPSHTRAETVAPGVSDYDKRNDPQESEYYKNQQSNLTADPVETDDQETDMSKISTVPHSDEKESDHERLPLYSTPIFTAIEDWTAEFHDAGRLKSNRARAMSLWHASGLDEERFLMHMYEARRRAKKALVQKNSSDGIMPNRMPYFFATLEDLLADDPKSATS